MAREHRRRIALWRACHQLLDHVEAVRQELAHSEPALCRGLPQVGGGLVDHLAAGDLAGAERALDRLGDDLDLAVRRQGLLPVLLAACRSLEVVRNRLWVPIERDGAPTVNREPPDFETRAAPVEAP